jgi:hypothetical protein
VQAGTLNGAPIPLPMTEKHTAALDEIVAMLESAGLLIRTTEDSKPALQLTPKRAQVATQMAMSSEADALAMFNALLDAAEADTSLG